MHSRRHVKIITVSVAVDTFATHLSAVTQAYEGNVFMANVIVGNDALLKCDIPSFVQDFVSVDGWLDSEGKNIGHGQFDSTCNLQLRRCLSLKVQCR